ncbi:hypothetical protein ACKKBF_B38915 [Auxenochlorella protothecoides x Auxenochlorella symbiontica]
MSALSLSTSLAHVGRLTQASSRTRTAHTRPAARPRMLLSRASADVDADGIVSGEWEASWSLASYDDVQEYFNRRVLKEGQHPTTRLASVMSKDLRTVYPDDPISEASRHFDVVSGLPVLRPEDDALIGVITVKDVNTKTGSLVKDIMTSPPIALHVTNKVEHAAATMLKYKIHRIPIVDDSKRVVGMVTRTDLFNALAGRDAQL